MATPISSLKYQAQPVVEAAQEESQPTQDTLKVENKKTQQLSLQDQFDKLTSSYYATLHETAGYGDFVQGYIDAEYAKLVKFTNAHPEFKAKLLEKHIADNCG
jgi:hypothetical protein